LCEKRDVAADKCLQATAERAENRARTHRNATHDAQVSDDAKPRQFKRGRDHVMRNRITRRRYRIWCLSIDLVAHVFNAPGASIFSEARAGSRLGQFREPPVGFAWRMQSDGSHSSLFQNRKQEWILHSATLVGLQSPQDDRITRESAAQTLSIPVAAFFVE